jgi:DNA invertase Pin-like site-specific DNA recombinase
MSQRRDTSGLPGVIYTRISRKFGEGEGSLDNQYERCARKAEADGVSIPTQWVFRERDSGFETWDSRVEMMKVRQLALSGKISTIYIHAWDRLSRVQSELPHVWRELRRQGVNVVSIFCPVDQMDELTASIVLGAIGTATEMELHNIRRRTTENKQRIRDAGKRVGEGGPRFGYKWLTNEDGTIHDSRAWIIDDPAAEVIRVIFDLIGNRGYSIRQAMEFLNAEPAKYPPPSVYRGDKFKDGRTVRWSYNLRKIIVDETYKGVATCSRKERLSKGVFKELPRDQWKELTNAPTPAIVDPELWARANANLKNAVNVFERARNFAAERNGVDFCFFRGILRCSVCKRHMRVMRIRQWDKKAKRHTGRYKIAYHCDTRWNKALPPEERVCSGRAVYDEEAREKCWAGIVKIITEEGWIEACVRRLKAERPEEEVHRAAQVAAEEERQRTIRRIGNYIDQLGDATDHEHQADLNAKIRQLREARKHCEARIAALEEKLAAYDQLDGRCDEILRTVVAMRDRMVNADKLSWPERRRIIDGVKASFLGSGDEIQVLIHTGLDDVSIPQGPFVVSATLSRRSINHEQRLVLRWSVAELLVDS